MADSSRFGKNSKNPAFQIFLHLIFPLGLFIVSIITFFIESLWWVVALSAFRVQFAAIALLLMLWFLWRRNWIIAISMISVVGLNGHPIYSYCSTCFTFPAQQTINIPKSTIKVVQLNLRERNAHFQDVLSFANDEAPDILVLQEFTEAWLQQLKSLSAQYGYYDLGNADVLGQRVVLYSRFPIFDVERYNFGGIQNSGLRLNLDINGKNVSLIGVHLRAPISQKHFNVLLQQIDELSTLANTLEHPAIIVGDFNMPPWSPSLQNFTSSASLHDTRRLLPFTPTWPSPLPWAGVQIDHVFTSSELVIAHKELGGSVGSDHRPLLVWIDVLYTK